MHSKFRSCVVLFLMAEWLKYVIIGCVDLLRGFWGGKGATEHIFKSYYLFPFGKSFRILSLQLVPETSKWPFNYILQACLSDWLLFHPNSWGVFFSFFLPGQGQVTYHNKQTFWALGYITGIDVFVSRYERASVTAADRRRQVRERRGERWCGMKKERKGEMLISTLRHSERELVSENTYSHLHTRSHTHTHWQNRIWRHCSTSWMCPSSNCISACCSKWECTVQAGAQQSDREKEAETGLVHMREQIKYFDY